MPNAPELNTKTESASRSWAWPTACMVVVLILTAGGIYVFKSCRDVPGEVIDKTGKAVHAAGEQLALVAAAFKQGKITTTFTSYATSLSGSQFLQFATLSQHEKFTRRDEASVGFGYIPLPDVVVEATAPVTYTYYLDLKDRWDFVIENGEILVTAPKIRFNKPAVDASRIEYEVKKDSLLRKTREAMDNLKNSITYLSYKRAQSNIELVRDTGRKQTEEFVRNWLARSFTDGKKYPVRVRFRDETGVLDPSKTQKSG
ncbi:MAG TPA: hypothetical protein VJA21_33885 [Verrucomicrobiae bacterium]